MKHRVGFNRLGRKPSHRKALHRNMVTSLFRHERIRTTKAKAQAIRRVAEKMITRAKVDSVHNRRIVARDIKDKNVLAKLFVEIGPRFKERPGGYTRMLKIGYRPGDAAPMVLLELLHADEGSSKEEKKSRRSRKSSSGDKASAKAATPKQKRGPEPVSKPEATGEVEESTIEAQPEESPEEAGAEATDEGMPEEKNAEESQESESEGAESEDFDSSEKDS